ncbi:MAG: hypothetical protein ACD_22C00127G0008 [uncultured bacterium]|nr:MAG: hypothetical protein ACD_22C00127G0008 [uncultured bacterium]
MKTYKWLLLSAVIIFLFLFNYFFSIGIRITPKRQSNVAGTNKLTASSINTIPNKVITVQPVTKVVLPISWGDFGKRIVADGVIDKTKFDSVMGSLSDEDKALIDGNVENITMTENNSRLILNLLWAFGLANKNAVLDKGEIMQDPTQAGNYASTGGWTLSKGNAMNYFSKSNYVVLDAEQQKMVEDMSKNIFRPCCNNSTHFPDCNHGIAMLGLLELMAQNGVSQEEAYKVALQVNSIWFPQTYQDLAVYFSENGTSIDKVDPAEVLSAKYSSASGYRQTRSQIKSIPQPAKGSGGCGV